MQFIIAGFVLLLMKAFRSVNGLAVDKIATGISEGKIRNVVVLTGAGVSSAAGIPDFRSPGGLYDTLRPELLTATPAQKTMLKSDPTHVVSIDIFRQNQFPYLEVRRPFILGTAEKRWKATLSHYFFQILHDKGILRRIYSQNIDGLDQQTDIPQELISNVHGTLCQASCEFCQTSMSNEEFHDEIKSKIRNIYDSDDTTSPSISSNILCKSCLRPGIKPNTVLYGTQLPNSFFNNIKSDFPNHCDLLLVAGTSLTVSPACDLVFQVSECTPRAVVDRNPVGMHLGLDYMSSNSRDMFFPGECDVVFLELACRLGWFDELYRLKDRMAAASVKLLHETYNKLNQQLEEKSS